jgi:hypothetical protein
MSVARRVQIRESGLSTAMNLRRLTLSTLCALAAALSVTFLVHNFRDSGSLAGHTIAIANPVPALLRSLRLNYPFSVVPGGVYSPAEIRYADRSPLVHKHYAGLDLKAARMVQLTADKYQYASYRFEDKIYWTRQKLRIPKGELLLSDGQNYVRSRCGNRLSDLPQPQVSPHEPAASLLSLPPLDPNILPRLALAEAPPLGELAQQFAVVPDSSPRLGAVLPSGTRTAFGDQGSSPQSFPAPGANVSGSFVSMGSPAGGGPGTNTHTPPATPPSEIPPILPPSIPPVVSPVPEPGSVYLFVVTFLLSLWALARMIPKETLPKQPAHKPQDASETAAPCSPLD